MSLLSNFFRKKPNALLAEVEIAPGLAMPKVFADHWPVIKKTEKQAIAITAKPADNLTLRQSKFGHYPCLPKGFSYPLSKAGNYMFPLAQINCSELPSQTILPSSGYLQFYIGLEDGVYGLSLDDNVPSDFKVLFFEEHEVTEPENNLSFLEDTLNSSEAPFQRAHSLSFQIKKEYVGIGDYESEHNPDFNLQDVLNQHPSLSDKLENIAYDLFTSAGHKLGGYAYFTQTDPREENSAIENFKLLFQMDSDDDIMWGDCGVANFFIHPDDLSKKDFSRVVYNWDCS